MAETFTKLITSLLSEPDLPIHLRRTYQLKLQRFKPLNRRHVEEVGRFDETSELVLENAQFERVQSHYSTEDGVQRAVVRQSASAS